MTLLAEVSGAVRTRGGLRGSAGEPAVADEFHLDALLRLEKIGLQEAGIRRLLQVVETACTDDRERVAAALGGTLAQLAQTLESPARCAVIPAAGGQHRLLAPAVMQRLLLRVMAEAAEEGICDIVLILSPGSEEALFKPLAEALEMAVVPRIRMDCAIQAKPEGIGDAILQAENFVRGGPFAVLLPDDFAAEDRAHRKYPQALRAMMDVLKDQPESNLLAVTPVMKSKVSSYGIVKIRPEKNSDRIHRVEMLVEKPDPRNPICRREPIFRIAGRYLLQPGIFDAVRELKKRGAVPVELTGAIEIMRSKGRKTFAVEVKQTGEDMSRLIGRALGMMQK
jgi:UTP--glucose-1-phosphate uridylyltransferase